MVLPNQLTVIRIILTPIFVVLFLSERQISKEISLIVFFIAALTDWYDGWLARKFNYITDWGKFWDPMADKILTAGAFLCFVYLDVLQVWMVILILIRDFLITGLRGYADYKGKSFVTSRYAKFKTFVQMIFLYYLLIIYVLSFEPYFQENYSHIFNILLNKYFVYYTMLFITFITLHSGYIYIKRNFSLIKTLLKN